ncbi:hypothetical protein SASPL_120933 [Salvia splendens]|uniref:Uncharacterized protein n=1 Tax=Salvia splendens TaxID=180675 RepID=A0A8X8XTE5_SALSN|nr:hypothetical protein SASPL_120933 [Salvia splendens]
MEKDKVELVEERGEEEVVDGDRIIIYPTRNKKTKKGLKEEDDEQLEIEEGKQRKKLESFLFSSLYSPIGFGNDDDDDDNEAIGEVDNSSAVFFTDRSADSTLSVYEEDIESGDETPDAYRNNERKPVWVDDEERKTRSCFVLLVREIEWERERELVCAFEISSLSVSNLRNLGVFLEEL